MRSDRCTGTELRAASSRSAKKCYSSTRALSIRPFCEWNRRDGLLPSGALLRRIARRDFIPLRQPGGDGSPGKPRIGGACHPRLSASLDLIQAAWLRSADELVER